MKSQTFIDPNTRSLPSLIGITLGLTIPNAILARNLVANLCMEDLLTKLSQSDKRYLNKDKHSVRTQNARPYEKMCQQACKKKNWSSRSRSCLLGLSKRTEMHLAGPNNFLFEGVLVKT